LTEQQALKAAIIANPFDDTARLVYSDWLRENGQDDRADFIKFQIERHKLVGSHRQWCGNCRAGYRHKGPGMETLIGEGDYCQCYLLKKKCDKLLRDNFRAWVPEIISKNNENLWIYSYPLPFDRPLRMEFDQFCAFERGFISRMWVSARTFTTHGAKILSLEPITEVNLLTMPLIRDYGTYPGDLSYFVFGHLLSMARTDSNPPANENEYNFLRRKIVVQFFRLFFPLIEVKLLTGWPTPVVSVVEAMSLDGSSGIVWRVPPPEKSAAPVTVPRRRNRKRR
jgi:uncharacterized protein (TIGR02996 family)